MSLAQKTKDKRQKTVCTNCDYRLRTGKVLKIDQLCKDIKSFKIALEGDKLFFTPGQFVMLSIFGYGEIAVGITTNPQENDSFEVCIRAVGNTTKAAHLLKVGDQIGIRGPYGNGFSVEKIKGRDLIIVGGGIGIAPLRSLISFAKANKGYFQSIQILYGAKSPTDIVYSEDLVLCEKFARVMITVDNPEKDWQGPVGVITDLVSKVQITPSPVVIMCGPPIMYKFMIPKLEAIGVVDKDIHVLLERRMKCGIGKCQHCTFGDKYVCLDGPVFAWSDIKDNVEAL